jgi:2-oxo-4-hydroxy-4-carboxy-5-ureidoimidazoline decarboxylase
MNMNKKSISTLSTLSQQVFKETLADIFEHSPWIPERAWNSRPFTSVDNLYMAMMKVLESATATEQLGLICAHPELAGKEATAGTLTKSSTTEQQGAGLDQCSKEELDRLRKLNFDYFEQFGFPFVVAVKNMSRYQIMDSIEARLRNQRDTEFATCLNEIGKIARFRLGVMFD